MNAIVTPVQNSYRLMAVRILVRALQDAEYYWEGEHGRDNAVIRVSQELTQSPLRGERPPAGGVIQAAFYTIYTDGLWAGGLDRSQFAQHFPEALEKFFRGDK